MCVVSNLMKPTEDEIKEVYAEFGLSYYLSECLHKAVCNLWALSKIQDPKFMTRSRMEELFSYAYSSTLGTSAKEIDSLLTPEQSNQLEAALDSRNFLAHHFWFERIHYMKDSDGISYLIEELVRYQRLFQSVEAQFQKILEPYFANLGITEEKIERSLKIVFEGKDSPLMHQRKLRKQEILKAVYEVPIENEGSTLIFQTDDNLLWQLCDVGLGWSLFEKVDKDWERLTEFNEFLPVRVNPRPDITNSWNYQITLKKGASLIVSLGPKEKMFRWKLRKPPNQRIHPTRKRRG